MMSRPFGALVLPALLAASAGQVAAETGPDRPDGAFCRPLASGGCECSFGGLETTLTFGEAAGVVLTYYRTFPDERYSIFLERLLRQCGDGARHPAPVVRATIRQDGTTPASAPSRLLGRAGGARP